MKDKKFRTEVDKAKGLDKVKKVGKYVYDTNKDLAADLKTQAENFDMEEAKKNVKKTVENVKQNLEEIRDTLLTKLHDIEDQVNRYYVDLKSNIDDLDLGDRYREISSKIALYAKSLKKYIEEGIITVEEKLNLETRLANISKKLKAAKR